MEWDKTSFAYQENDEYYILEKDIEKKSEQKKTEESKHEAQNPKAQDTVSEKNSLSRKASSEKIERLEKLIQEKDTTIEKLKKVMQSSNEPCPDDNILQEKEVEYIQVDEMILDENGKAEELYIP